MDVFIYSQLLSLSPSVGWLWDSVSESAEALYNATEIIYSFCFACAVLTLKYFNYPAT